MSHFSTIKTQIKEAKPLIKALNQLGYVINQDKKFVKGYRGKFTAVDISMDLPSDTKVGFNIMSDPTKPTEVSTFDFVAPPETMESMESRGEEDLGTKTFGKLFNIARQKKQGFSGLEM